MTSSCSVSGNRPRWRCTRRTRPYSPTRLGVPHGASTAHHVTAQVFDHGHRRGTPTIVGTSSCMQGRFLGGRPPYGYRLADAGPHPNRAHASWGRRAHRLKPDPATAPIVTWMFAQRLAGHSAARITRALNDAQVPCPSAADPGRNPHRTGAGWTLRTVAAILANPRYTGRQVQNRQRTDFDLAGPANTGLGHRQVQRWNLPEGWVISRHPAHPALVSEAGFIAAQ